MGLFLRHPRSCLSLGNILDGLRQGVVCLRDLGMSDLASAHVIDAARIRNSSALIR
jgi:hypothetical protein